jgi:hypothetical protein
VVRHIWDGGKSGICGINERESRSKTVAGPGSYPALCQSSDFQKKTHIGATGWHGVKEEETLGSTDE